MRAEECDDRRLIDLTEKLDPDKMSPRDDTFLRGIQGQRTLSVKQRRWLVSILETNKVLDPPEQRYGRAVGAAPTLGAGVPAAAQRAFDAARTLQVQTAPDEPYEPDF